MNQRVHEVIVDLPKHLVGGPPGKDNKLDSKQGHKDQGSLHSLQVHVGFGLMVLPHLGHKHPDDVQQKEEVDLQRYDIMSKPCGQAHLRMSIVLSSHVSSVESRRDHLGCHIISSASPETPNVEFSDLYSFSLLWFFP